MKFKNKIIDTIYIKNDTVNFWWGEYNLCDISDEEIYIYLDKKCKKRIGHVDIYTKPTVQYILDEHDNEKDFIKKAQKFLQGDSYMYDYIYPRDLNDRLFHQVKHNAPKDSRGLKPIYIMMWYPEDKLNVSELKKCTKIFMKDAYEVDVLNVDLVSVTSYEEAKKSYEEALEYDRQMGIVHE
jgi:hypothetical protein